jgi:hypothetical protein
MDHLNNYIRITFAKYLLNKNEERHYKFIVGTLEFDIVFKHNYNPEYLYECDVVVGDIMASTFEFNDTSNLAQEIFEDLQHPD